MSHESILIKDGILVTMNERGEVIKNGSILIEGGKISNIGKKGEAEKKADVVIEAKGKIVLPGLINAHNHVCQFLARGRAYDIPFPVWDSEYMFKIYGFARPEDYYAIASLCGLEMLKTGTTCVVDNVFTRGVGEADKIAEAFEDLDLRACIACGFMDRAVPEYIILDKDSGLKECKRVYRQWNGKNDKIRVWFAPPGFGMCTEDNLKESFRLAGELKTKVQTHVSATLSAAMNPLWEHGKREVEYLSDLGILSPDTVAVHCVWVNDKDIQLIKRAGTKVVHNPASNMYLAFGVAPVLQMIREGITVSLGVDGLGSNTSDMFEIMRAAAYLHKLHNFDSTAIDAKKVLEMATIDGARTLGLEHEIGSIEVGKKADLIAIDIQRPNLTPLRDAYSMIVYCAKGDDVSDVIIDGEIVMRDGAFLNLDESKIIDKAKERIESFWLDKERR